LLLLLLLLQVPFTITPGSEQIRATIARDGLMDIFTQVGSTLRGEQQQQQQQWP
jgi:aconitase A